jgi:hypothetical protein
MHLYQKQFIRAMAATALVPLLAASPNAFAQAPEHVVSSSDLQKATVDASQARQKNLDTLNKFFSSVEAQKALKDAHMNAEEVKSATAGLSDDDLAQLSARATKAQNDFKAGTMSDRDLLIVLVLIAALILIIVAVH